MEALRSEDTSFFLSWPSVHTWRLYSTFRSQTLFLDIEIGRHPSDIILVGLFDGFNTWTLVKRSTLDKKMFFSLLRPYKLLVTFNGSSFDIPALEKYFGAPILLPHIDLKHCCATLGLYGGLKEIERRLHLSRPSHLSGSPIDLWRAYHASGDIEYLQLLVAYNEEDIVNLKPLMEYCSRELAHRLLAS